MTPLWREQAVHAIDVALAEAIYSLAVLPALIQRQTDVPASADLPPSAVPVVTEKVRG